MIDLQQLCDAGLEQARAEAVLTDINDCLSNNKGDVAWQRISQQVLTRQDPFAAHLLAFNACQQHHAGYAWFPNNDTIAEANLTQLMQTLNIKNYQEFHQWSVEHKSDFWQLMIDTLAIPFAQPYDKIRGDETNIENPQWLSGATLNIAEACLQAPADKIAIIAHTESNQEITWTYGELDAYSNRIANSLCALGLKAGDSIAIDMLMNAEAVAIYLGIIKMGAHVVAIADSFAPNEIATRLDIANANAIFTQDYIERDGKKIPMYEKVCAAQPKQAIVFNPHQLALREQDISFTDFLVDSADFNAVPCEPQAVTNILFSSGTTGTPKAIPWDHTTPIKVAADAYLHQNIKADDVLAWPTNLGWMMGPWLVYASLINQATIALFHGSPNTTAFGRFIEASQVTMLGVVPSLVNNWRAKATMEQFDWSTIKCFSSTGECSNAEDMLYLMYLANYKPVIEYCGGTEIGGAYLSSTVLHANQPACFSTPTCGLAITLLDEQGNVSELGEVALRGPSIGLSTRLLNRDHHTVYFENMPKDENGETLRRHGDQLQRLDNDYYRALGRVDDTMNLGGIKTSSADIERTLSDLEAIKETAAIAVSPAGGGPKQLVIYAVVENTAIDNASLKKQCQQQIRNQLNPLFKIHDLVIIDKLPRTASNKVMRRVLRDEYLQ